MVTPCYWQLHAPSSQYGVICKHTMSLNCMLPSSQYGVMSTHDDSQLHASILAVRSNVNTRRVSEASNAASQSDVWSHDGNSNVGEIKYGLQRIRHTESHRNFSDDEFPSVFSSAVDSGLYSAPLRSLGIDSGAILIIVGWFETGVAADRRS